EERLADAAQLASLADETPEGRSIVVLAKERYGLRGRELAPHDARFVPFTAQTRMSGVDYDGRVIRKGAVDAIEAHVRGSGGAAPAELRQIVERVSRAGGTPLVVAEMTAMTAPALATAGAAHAVGEAAPLGVIYLKDIV